MPAGNNPRTINGPVFIAATSGGTNIPTGGSGSALAAPATNTFWVIKHIRLQNTDSSARTVSLYKDATGTSTAGKEILPAKSIAANDYLDVFFPSGDRWTTADFMSGFASITNKVVIQVFGEIYAA